jgi:hypothetical protein
MILIKLILSCAFDSDHTSFVEILPPQWWTIRSYPFELQYLTLSLTAFGQFAQHFYDGLNKCVTKIFQLQNLKKYLFVQVILQIIFT